MEKKSTKEGTKIENKTKFFDRVRFLYCTIISFVILGQLHDNLFTFFSLPGVKKKNELLWNFFNEITKPISNQGF